MSRWTREILSLSVSLSDAAPIGKNGREIGSRGEAIAVDVPFGVVAPERKHHSQILMTGGCTLMTKMRS